MRRYVFHSAAADGAYTRKCARENYNTRITDLGEDGQILLLCLDS